MVEWIINNKKGDYKKMSQVLYLDEIVAKILINRDINTKNKVKRFTNSIIDNLEDFSKVKDIEKSFDILDFHIKNKKKITIYGDYDVDGVMSSTILYKGLKLLTENVTYYLPHREKEGYGLNSKSIEEIKAKGCNLIITCDNGIVALSEIKLIKQLGMDVIVIDHHNQGDVLPQADAIINPKRVDCTFSFKEMCAGGLSYRFIEHYFKTREKDLVNKDELIVLGMVATFCDIVDLIEDNRIIAKEGLKILNEKKDINLGLSILLKEKKISDKKITEDMVGFIIGPCINAAGRLEKASMAVDLLTSNSVEVCRDLAEKIAQLNENRKDLTKKSYEQVLKIIIDKNKLDEEKIIIVYEEGIEESIAGILAGRLKEKFYKPVIVLTNSEGELKASARSIEGCNIFEILNENKKLFNKFGGHSAAAGFSINKENFEILKKNLSVSQILKKCKLVKIIKIEKILKLEEVIFELAQKLEILKPAGKGNDQPLFISKKMKIDSVRIIEEKNTIIFTLSTEHNRKIKALYFGEVDKFENILKDSYDEYEIEKIKGSIFRNIDVYIDGVYSIEINEFRGNTSVQLMLKDMRLSEK